MNKEKALLFYLFGGALIIKFVLFALIAHHAPQTILEADSPGYLEPGMTLVEKGVFARGVPENGNIFYERFRTPGYPLFLGILHGALNIPLNGVIVIQILLTLAAALITYKAAIEIDQRLGMLSAAIILFDPPITIFSYMILTEALFVFFMSLFLLTFIRYLKGHTISWLIFSALILTAATYIRPVTYFLAAAAALFILYAGIRSNRKQAMTHALIFIILAHSLLGIWQWRNYQRSHDAAFSDIGSATVSSHFATGLWKSYPRNQDPQTQGMPAPMYYANVSLRCALSLFTRPGTFKYFDIDWLKIAGKVFGYPWMAFWLVGFFAALLGLRKDIRLQFLLYVVVYLTGVTVVATMWGSGERFRVPMMPFIAILSAWGWHLIMEKFSRRTSRK